MMVIGCSLIGKSVQIIQATRNEIRKEVNVSRQRQKEADRKRAIYYGRVNALKEITSAHRQIIFGDCPDTMMNPQREVICTDVPSKC